MIFLACLLIPCVVYSAGSPIGYFNPMTSVILWVTIIFFFAISGRYVAETFNQPGVLGELLAGVFVGNLLYHLGMPLGTVLREGPITFDIFNDLLNGLSLKESINQHATNPDMAKDFLNALQGESGPSWLKVAYVLDIFSRYGVIFLLFMVGLETSVDELKRTGKESLVVAIIGVIAPVILGYFLMRFMMPDVGYQTDLFVAATLSATSIGISARVLKEIKIMHTREAKTILGAAMIDDILGLILLAIVSSIIITGAVDLYNIIRIFILAILFFSIALLVGPFILRKTLNLFGKLAPWERKLFVSFLFVMILSWIAELIQLATIIGAFAAGIILYEGFFQRKESRHDRLTLVELVAPLEFILAPLFFVLMGIQVKFEIFMDWKVLLLATSFTMVAILGKLLSGFGAHKRDDRLLVGIGMLPRGEVGLIFASIGRKLEVMSDNLFAAVILMIIVTTFIAPSCIKCRWSQISQSKNSLK